MTMLLNSGDESSSSRSRDDVFRVITPDNIASLFGSASSARNSKLTSIDAKAVNASTTSSFRILEEEEDEDELLVERGIGNDNSRDSLRPADWNMSDTTMQLSADTCSAEGIEGDEDEVYGDLNGTLDIVSVPYLL